MQHSMQECKLLISELFLPFAVSKADFLKHTMFCCCAVWVSYSTDCLSVLRRIQSSDRSWGLVVGEVAASMSDLFFFSFPVFAKTIPLQHLNCADSVCVSVWAYECSWFSIYSFGCGWVTEENTKREKTKKWRNVGWVNQSWFLLKVVVQGYLASLLRCTVKVNICAFNRLLLKAELFDLK